MEKSNIKKCYSKELIFNYLRQKVYINLYKKYSSNQFSFNSILINKIIFNIPCLIVAKFKDFLVYDDNGEFLTNFFNKIDCIDKLNKLLHLYETYSKVFPNYLVIKEKKFMYKNIRKKQKMIDAFNLILIEEAENRKKMKNDENILNCDNKIFTIDVKEEIKLYQQNTTFRRYKNSFDMESNKEDTLPWNSSISISLLNNKYLNRNDNNILNGKSLDSFLINDTNRTLSSLINVMNESKIYVKELPNLLGINNYSKNSNILKNAENKDKKSNKNIIKEKFISLKNIKDINNNLNNINKNDTKNNLYNNEIIKEIKTTEKNDEKQNKEKNNLISPPLPKKETNKVNSNNGKEDSDKHNIILSSVGETIININNNFFHSPIQTERYEDPKIELSLKDNLNSNYKSFNNNTIENKRLTTLPNNKLLKNNNSNSKLFKRIKSKHISQDLTFKKKLIKYLNNNTCKKTRDYSPQFIFGNQKKELTKEILKKSKHNNIVTERQDNNKHYVKSSTKSMNNF